MKDEFEEKIKNLLANVDEKNRQLQQNEIKNESKTRIL